MPLPLKVTSVKYLAGYDSYGNIRAIEIPAGRGVVVFDGQDFRNVDSSDQQPLVLPAMEVQKGGDLAYILGLTGAGQLIALNRDPSSTGNLALTNVGGVWTLKPASSTGGGTVDPGGGTGTPVPVAASGASSGGMDGVSANNLSPHSVRVKAPAYSLLSQDGTAEVRVSNVDVTADLESSLGVGGLDTGAESASKWYYIYIVSDGLGDVGAVISASPTEPSFLNLGAHIFYALAGCFRNDASSNIITYLQRGRDIFTRVQTVGGGSGLTITTSFTVIPGTVPLTNLLPPLVKTVSGLVGGGTVSSTVLAGTILAADSGGTGYQVAAYSQDVLNTDSYRVQLASFARLPIADPSTPQIFWKKAVDAGASSDAFRQASITGYSI